MKKYDHQILDVIVIHPMGVPVDLTVNSNLIKALNNGYEIISSNAISSSPAAGVEYVIRKEIKNEK